MSQREVHIPDLGGAEEVEVIELSVQPGDRVEAEQPLLVVESDKATVELPSPSAGVVQEFRVRVGDRVREGDLVALLSVEEEDAGPGAGGEQPASPQEPEAAPRAEAAQAEAPNTARENGGQQPAAETAREETVRVPDIGEVQEVTVIEVSVKPGDQVAAEDPLIVLESDKATMEIPAPAAGRVEEVLVKVNDQVSEGTPIVRMTLTESAAEPRPAPAEAPPKPAAPEPEAKPAPSPQPKAAPARQEAPQARPQPQEAGHGAKPVHAGPAVRRLAREFGVDLGLVQGSGPKQRILKEDVQGFVKRSLRQVATAGAVGAGLPTVKLPDFSQFGPVERRPLSKIQRATAENMHRSWLNVPHVTQFDLADITELEAFRKSQKAEAEQRGVKLTLMPFLIKACAYALKALPQFNVALDTQSWEFVQKHYIHIGMAVDTPAGLLVPVIRDADRKSIWELAQESADLAKRARDRKLQPGDMQGGCFTISSLGGVGGTAFTPIVNTPEVAILGVSKAQLQPQYRGDALESRLMLPLSLSYDHRALNGAEAARFTSLLVRLLEDIRQLLL